MRVANGSLQVRNRIYSRVFDRQWIAAHLPDAELRRQKAAYRRGLLRASAFAAVVLAAISGLAFTAVRQRNLATDEARRADRVAEQRQLALADAQDQRKIAEGQTTEANQQRQKALTQESLAEQRRIEAEQQRQAAVGQRLIAEDQRIRAEEQEHATSRSLYIAQIGLARQAWDTANMPRLLELLSAQWPKPGREDLRGFEWYHLWRISHRHLLSKPLDRLVSANFSPDGKKIVTVTDDNSGRQVRFWDTENGQELPTPGPLPRSVLRFAISPEGRRLAALSEDGTVILMDLDTGRKFGTFHKGIAGIPLAIALSRGGRWFAAGGPPTTGARSQLQLLDTVTGKSVTHTSEKPEIMFTPIAISEDGTRSRRGASLRKFKRGDGAVQPVGPLVFVMETATGRVLQSTRVHNQPLSIVFSPRRSNSRSGDDQRHSDAYRHGHWKKNHTLKTLKGHAGSINSIVFPRSSATFSSC